MQCWHAPTSPCMMAVCRYVPPAPGVVVGVMSRSGGMTTEICNALTLSGLGVSTAISIGGDPVIGSTYADLIPLFEADEDTKAVVVYSEPGGTAEAELARWTQEHKSRLPIVAFVAGRFMDEMPGMSFGHAGTVVNKKVDSPADKMRRMRKTAIKALSKQGTIRVNTAAIWQAVLEKGNPGLNPAYLSAVARDLKRALKLKRCQVTPPRARVRAAGKKVRKSKVAVKAMK